MVKPIHTCIRILDLQKSIDFYSQCFGLFVEATKDFPDCTLCYLRSDESDYELELTLNKGRTEPYTHGTGYSHIAFSVNNLEELMARIKSLGYETTPLKQMGAGASFCFVSDPDGYKIELIQRGGRYL